MQHGDRALAVAAAGLTLVGVIGVWPTRAASATLPDTTERAFTILEQEHPQVRVIDCPESGGYVTVVTPHPRFDPLTATDQELESNGFSPRPDTTDASYPEWVTYATGPIRRIDTCPDPRQRRGFTSQNFTPLDKDGHPIPLPPSTRPRYIASPMGAVEVVPEPEAPGHGGRPAYPR